MNLPLNDISLLIVDDDPPVASSLRRLFRRAGFSIHVADCGTQALELLESVAPQVVISDYRMPDISGVDVLLAVRERNEETVCVLISGYADSGTLQTSIKKLQKGHRFFFIPKPWDDDVFVQKVLDALHGRGATQ